MGGAQTERWTTVGSASVVALLPMIEYARGAGVCVDAILRGIDVPPTALRDFDRRIPQSSYVRAWVDASQSAGDAAFGLRAGLATRLSDFDVLGHALRFSATLGEGFERILRFHRVLCDAWAMAKEEMPAVVRFRRIERTPAAEAEAAFALLVAAGRQLTGQSLVPRAISFAHAAPANVSPYEEHFGCPVRFGAGVTALDVHRDSLDVSVRGADSRVVNVLERYLEKELAALPSGSSFAEQVRAAIVKMLREGERPGLAATSRTLRVSARTLQRRLLERGTDFSEMVDSVRRDLAERLLAQRQVSITEVAFLTGFADVSGFRRKYRRWTGRAPSQGTRHP